jgi:hypothetical protein
MLITVPMLVFAADFEVSENPVSWEFEARMYSQMASTPSEPLSPLSLGVSSCIISELEQGQHEI